MVEDSLGLSWTRTKNLDSRFILFRTGTFFESACQKVCWLVAGENSVINSAGRFTMSRLSSLVLLDNLIACSHQSVLVPASLKAFTALKEATRTGIINPSVKYVYLYLAVEWVSKVHDECQTLDMSAPSCPRTPGLISQCAHQTW